MLHMRISGLNFADAAIPGLPHPEYGWVCILLERYRLATDLRGDGIYAVGRKTGPGEGTVPRMALRMSADYLSPEVNLDAGDANRQPRFEFKTTRRRSGARPKARHRLIHLFDAEKPAPSSGWSARASPRAM